MLAGGASMFNLLLDWILSAVAIFLVAYVVPGFEISGFAAALLAALVVGLVNATLGLVLKILTFPITIVTLGIFWIVINALMLMLAASFVPGFSIQGFLPAFIGAIVLSLVNLVLRKIKRELREERE
jgi:putative membrane protein